MTKMKRCPYCGEEILAAAKKCKHCGEWIEKDETGQVTPHQASTPQQPIEPNPDFSNERVAVNISKGVLLSIVIITIFLSFVPETDSFVRLLGEPKVNNIKQAIFFVPWLFSAINYTFATLVSSWCTAFLFYLVGHGMIKRNELEKKNATPLMVLALIYLFGGVLVPISDEDTLVALFIPLAIISIVVFLYAGRTLTKQYSGPLYSLGRWMTYYVIADVILISICFVISFFDEYVSEFVMNSTEIIFDAAIVYKLYTTFYEDTNGVLRDCCVRGVGIFLFCYWAYFCCVAF